MRALLILLACAGCADEGQRRRRPEPEPMIDQVCINELMPRTEAGGDGSDWLELAGPPAFDLGGWALLWNRDDEQRFDLDALALDTDGFVLLLATGLQSPPDLPFKLSSDGETLGLEAPDGTREWVTWGPVAADYSLARSWDCCREDDCWEQVLMGTPGSTNGDRPEE